MWETTIGLARAIEILIIVCGRPAGGPHRGPPSTARAGVTTDSVGRPTDIQRTSNGRGKIRLEYLFPTLLGGASAGVVAPPGLRKQTLHRRTWYGRYAAVLPLCPGRAQKEPTTSPAIWGRRPGALLAGPGWGRGGRVGSKLGRVVLPAFGRDSEVGGARWSR